MAFTFGFYNSINHDRRYDAIQVGQIFDGIINDGVYATYKKAMVVKASSNGNEVIVQPGRAWFNHTWSYNDADLPVSMPGPETFYDRIDAVVLDIDSTNASRTNKILVVKGTPAPSPSRPSLIKTTEHNQYPLAYVRRYGQTNTIRADDITNAVGTSACPFVTGLLEVVSVDVILAQWQAQFSTYMRNREIEWEKFQQSFFQWIETQKGAYQEFLNHNYTAWENWFSHIQTELDGDVAGHLQEQIDRFAYIYVAEHVLYLPMSGASVVNSKLIFRTSNV